MKWRKRRRSDAKTKSVCFRNERTGITWCEHVWNLNFTSIRMFFVFRFQCHTAKHGSDHIHMQMHTFRSQLSGPGEMTSRGNDTFFFHEHRRRPALILQSFHKFSVDALNRQTHTASFQFSRPLYKCEKNKTFFIRVFSFYVAVSCMHLKCTKSHFR